MAEVKCSPDEMVVRAICAPDHYDPKEKRLSPSLFKGDRTSVSRLKVLPLEDHWDLFRKHVEKLPNRKLEMFGEIAVGKLREIGESYADRPTSLSVIEAPEEWNTAHAEIPENITRGLANKILPALKLHSPPAEHSART